MVNNLKNFKMVYKKFTKDTKEALIFYKSYGYHMMNSYLYNNLKIKELYINPYFIREIRKYYSANTKQLIDLTSINPGNVQSLIELYVNKNIVEKINILDKIFLIDNIPKLSGDEILYRGTNKHSITKKSSKVGDIVVSKNFMSTSTELNISENFTFLYMPMGKQKKTQNNDMCCMYVLHGLKDIPYVYIPWFITKAHVFEKLLISQIPSDEFEFLLPRGLKFKITKIESKVYRYSMTKNMSFSNLDKIISTSKQNNLSSSKIKTLNNNNVRRIFEKTNKKILTYHLEYVGQEPLTPIPKYNYDSSINIHIQTPQSNSPLKTSFPIDN